MGLSDKQIKKGGRKEKIQILTTSLDSLLAHVKRSKQSTLKNAARTCGISVDQAERWAILLRDKKLIDVRYPAFGDALLSIPGYKKKWRKK